MRRKERAAKAIAEAENELALLVSEAGQERAWDEATIFIDIGRRLQSIVEELSTTQATVTKSVGQSGKSASDLALIAPAASSKSVKKPMYPQFYKDGDTLTKVAWSKSQRAEYEHKSPLKVLRAISDSLLKAGSKGQRFAMEKLLPIMDAEQAGAEVPAYQAYVCLAWLRHVGLVQQHGRSGYSIPNPGGLLASVADSWNRLAPR